MKTERTRKTPTDSEAKLKTGDHVRLVSLTEKDNLNRYLREPPARIGDKGTLISDRGNGVFICAFWSYMLIVNRSMVKLID